MKNSRRRGWALVALIAIAACGGSTVGEIPPEEEPNEPNERVEVGAPSATLPSASAAPVATDGAAPIAHHDASTTPPQPKDASVGPWTPPHPHLPAPSQDGGIPFYDGGVPSFGWDGGFPKFDGGTFDGGFYRDGGISLFDGGISLFDGGINVPL